MQSRNLHNLEIALHILETACQSRDVWDQCAISRLHNFCWEPRSSFEFPSCITVRNICKELLQLCRLQHRACTQAPHARDCWEVCQLGELPSPRSGYGCRETLECPVQGIIISESPQLSSVSQLRHSHPVSLLRSRITLTQSQRLHKCIAQSQAISRLACSFWMCSAISRLRKFLDCVEHMCKYHWIQGNTNFDWEPTQKS